MDVTTQRLRNAFAFFKAHAGGIVGEAAKGALALARAEAWAQTNAYSDVTGTGLEYVWEFDEFADWSWLEQDFIPQSERDKEHEVTQVALVRVTKCTECGKETRETLASLGGIFDADANYRRVIEAELALEVMP